LDFITDIVRLFEISLGAIALGASPIHLPVVGFGWSMLVEPARQALRDANLPD
jgi:hypothetical protein